ncbi:MAG: permease [Bacillota bacterium]
MFKPIQILAEWLAYAVFGLVKGTHLSDAIVFFIFDSLKILILLLLVVFIISFIRTYWSPAKMRAFLSRKNKFLGYIFASALGIITPFCSCSAVPMFLGFVQAGVPLGTTFSFLISSPMINEVALALLIGMFGWKIASLYVVSGLLIAIISGIIIDRLKLEHLVLDFDSGERGDKALEGYRLTAAERLIYAKDYSVKILNKVWLYVIIGVAIGAWIHGYIPVEVLSTYANADNWYAVPLVTLIGIPLYANAAGVAPLVGVLTEKGVAMGTALSFMMAVTALSLPEFTILKRVMKMRLLLIFAGIVGVGIMFTGYLFNYILK